MIRILPSRNGWLDFGSTPEAAEAAEGLAEAIAESEQIIAEHKRRRPQAA